MKYDPQSIADNLQDMFRPMAKSMLAKGMDEDMLSTALAYVYNRAYQEACSGKMHFVDPRGEK